MRATLWNRFWCLVYGHDYDGPTGLCVICWRKK
jgi:hypothetical protein